MPNGNDPAGWLWAQACGLVDESARLQRQFFHLSRQPLAVWEPPVDVFEDERELVIVVAMPGVSAEGVQVISESGTLVVRGARAFPLAGSRHRVRQLEIPYGVFERRIVLPPGRFEIGKPDLIQGCLLLRLRKIGQIR